MADRRALAALALALAASGCATTSSYYAWGDYNEALYAHYQAPQARAAWVASLKATILAAEQAGRKVPPGIYAEYGYALFEEGQAGPAIVYFEKERALWPESRLLMDKLIRNAEQRGAQPPTPARGPGGALETTP